MLDKLLYNRRYPNSISKKMSIRYTNKVYVSRNERKMMSIILDCQNNFSKPPLNSTNLSYAKVGKTQRSNYTKYKTYELYYTKFVKINYWSKYNFNYSPHLTSFERWGAGGGA
jgi:hypothetical protein